MDEADISQSRLELEEELRRKYTHAPVLEVGHTGYCLNCGEPMQGVARWCNSDCLNDYQKRIACKR